LLEGNNVNLRVMEREDVDFATECFNDVTFWGEYDPVGAQKSKAERQKAFDNPPQVAILCERQRFVIEKKDGTKIGFIAFWFTQPGKMMEIGYNLILNERGKGYGTEAVQLIVDYLFLSKDLLRVQAITDVRNKPSQRVLEKAGFQREGTIRKSGFVRGEVSNGYLYGIIREDWKEPKILTRHSK
jgi:RimJ/RimL family protein N-acetyltransferase